jgi:hypothetical protein
VCVCVCVCVCRSLLGQQEIDIWSARYVPARLFIAGTLGFVFLLLSGRLGLYFSCCSDSDLSAVQLCVSQIQIRVFL